MISPHVSKVKLGFAFLGNQHPPLHVAFTSEDFSRGRWTAMTNEPTQFCFSKRVANLLKCTQDNARAGI